MYILGTIIEHIEHELGQSTPAVPGLSRSATRNYWLDFSHHRTIMADISCLSI
jgi:hypothetical protein